MVDKKEIEKLMSIADKVLHENKDGMVANVDSCEIYDSYNGQIAALGVSISMIGLIPTLAIYYQDSAEGNKPNRRTVIAVIARMLELADSRYQFEDKQKGVLEYALRLSKLANEQQEQQKKLVYLGKLKELKKAVLSCSVALKHVVRTYKLVSYE